MFDLKKEIIKSIIPSGIACALISFVLNYFVIPMPKDVMGNAIGNGISGLFSGAISAAITTVILVKVANANSSKVRW